MLFIISNNKYYGLNFKFFPSDRLICNAKKVKEVMEGRRKGEKARIYELPGCKNNAYTFHPHKTQHPMVQDGATTRLKYHSGDFRWLCSAHHSCRARSGRRRRGRGGSMEPVAEGAPLRPPRARDACAQNIKRLFLYEAS